MKNNVYKIQIELKFVDILENSDDRIPLTEEQIEKNLNINIGNPYMCMRCRLDVVKRDIQKIDEEEL